MLLVKSLLLSWLGIWIVLTIGGPHALMAFSKKESERVNTPQNIWGSYAGISYNIEKIVIDPSLNVWVSGGEKRQNANEEAGYLSVFIAGFLDKTFSSKEVGIEPRAMDFALQGREAIWIATRQDVAVYDGKKWQVLPKSPFNKQGCWHTAIEIDGMGRAWLGSKCGLAVFIDEAWEEVPVRDRSIHVTSLAVDAHNDLWMGTEGDGLFLREQDKEEWRQFLPSAVLPPYESNFRVDAIAFHPNGRVWVATSNGLASLDPTQNTAPGPTGWRAEYPVGDMFGTSTLAIDKNQRIYSYINWKGLLIGDPSGNWEIIDRFQVPSGQVVSIPRIVDISVERNNQVWLAGAPVNAGEGPALFSLRYQVPIDINLEPPLLPGFHGYIIPWHTWMTVALLIGLFVAVLTTKPLRFNEEIEGSNSTLQSPRHFRIRWILGNGVAWMGALGVIFTVVNITTLLGWAEVPDWSFLMIYLSLPPWVYVLTAVLLASFQAAAHWMAIAPVSPYAPRWALYTFLGTLAGYVLFIGQNLVLWRTLLGPSPILTGETEMLFLMIYCAAPYFFIILPGAYLLSFYLGGKMAGARQQQMPGTGVLATVVWKRENARAMVLAGLTGPIGGFVYGVTTANELAYHLLNPLLEEATTAVNPQ